MSYEYDAIDPVLRGIANNMLDRQFGAEWHSLDAGDRRLVLADFVEASDQDADFCVITYHGNIGEGNLQSYAKCLR